MVTNPEGGRDEGVVRCGHSLHQRSRDSDGCGAGLGADLEPEQHAYRPGQNAQNAVREVARLLGTGYTEVVDADLSGYFDSIPHAELLKSVARRISDSRVLRLIKMWLQTPVEETDGKG